jgi:hypothetical protein
MRESSLPIPLSCTFGKIATSAMECRLPNTC